MVWSKKNKDTLTNANTTNPVGGIRSKYLTHAKQLPPLVILKYLSLASLTIAALLALATNIYRTYSYINSGYSFRSALVLTN